MVDGSADSTPKMILAFMIIFSLFLLCSCTITIQPVNKKSVKHHPQVHRVVRHKVVSKAGSNGTSVIGTDESGCTRVTKSWVMRYKDLEKLFGKYPKDDEEITETDNPNVYAIGSGVRNHFADMKRQQVQFSPSPTP